MIQAYTRVQDGVCGDANDSSAGVSPFSKLGKFQQSHGRYSIYTILVLPHKAFYLQHFLCEHLFYCTTGQVLILLDMLPPLYPASGPFNIQHWDRYPAFISGTVSNWIQNTVFEKGQIFQQALSELRQNFTEQSIVFNGFFYAFFVINSYKLVCATCI